MPPTKTMFGSVGWPTSVLSYQPWAPSQLGSVPASIVSDQLAPPLVESHSSECAAPSAEAKSRRWFVGQMASSKRPVKSVMPVLLKAQVRPRSTF